ncbi:hypothetical protein SAY86_028406 [Trapa natans]|uniref:Tim44-like domain-containing protein n=1 Tax=Trapa natans TaxID=22666 RepID=A0AAN7LZP3_TRANT|nr:hypothetical protein SAY86_028406 [Trapa natans]
MASRKLVRDLALVGQPLFTRLRLQRQPLNWSLRSVPLDGYLGDRPFSVFNKFSEKVKGEASRNQEFQQSVKELKEKAQELKGVKEDLKIRTKKTTEQLYKQVDGVWTDAEATAKKVSANIKEKISAAQEEFKERLGSGKEESSADSPKQDAEENFGNTDSASAEGKRQQSGSNSDSETMFNKFKSSGFSASPKVSSAFERLKKVKVVDLAKKGYDILKEELNGTPTNRKKHMEAAPPPETGERSTRTEVVIVPSQQSKWSKKWESFKEKMQGLPVFKRISNISEPVVMKGQEIAEDIRERWETTDNPVVHKIQDINETIFQETDAAASMKEIRRPDPSFSLPDFVSEIQEVIKPVLNAYMKADAETLRKYCSSEVIERCKAEHTAYQSHGIFFDNKILHVSDIEVRETKMMGTSPIIILAFQTQQVYCVRDRNGAVTEGGKDTIHTVYYAWAMQQIDPEELGECAVYPVWKLREMQQIGVRALI